MQQIIGRMVTVAIFMLFATLASPSSLRAQNDAAKTFKANCTLCHGEDGGANTPTGKALKAKDLRSDEVQKQTDAQLAAVISKGRAKMPAFGSKFSPDLINALVAYIRQLPKK
ncbi:MAG: cytochrome c [Candidatus Acidiferrales bacterium]